MDLESVGYQLEFYTEQGNQVEHYRMPGPFLCPRVGERVHLHKGSLAMEVMRVVHDLVEHEGGHIQHTAKIFGAEIVAVE
jgi:hypothetical protein